jgi:ferredoxin-NADP reductase
VQPPALLAGLANGHRYVCFSRPGPGDALGPDYDAAGRLTAKVLISLDLPAIAEAYICGPPGFMTDISVALNRLGFDRNRIRTEVFGAGPASTPGIATHAARPRISRQAGQAKDRRSRSRVRRCT